MGITSVLGSSALLPAGLGFRNALINGDFRVNQRVFSSTTNNGAYGFDRWRIDASGGTTTYSAQTFTPGNAISGQEPTNYARVVTTGQSNTNGTYSLFRQPIEDVRTFAGQTVTVSFWAKASSGTPKVSIELEQNFGSGGSASIIQYAGQVTLSTSWQKFTLTTIIPSISGKTIGTNSHLLFTFILSGGPDWNTRSSSIGIQSNTFDFWGVQLEQNYQATPFEQRPFAVELQLCQRYYEKSYDIGTAPGTATDSGFILAMPGGAQASSSGIHDAYINFKVTKRTAASMTIYDNAGNSNKCRRTAVGSANYDNQSIQDVSGYTNGCYFRSATGSGSTHTVSCHYVASAEF